MKIRIDARYGEVKLGPFRYHWFNADETGDGFTVLSWGNWNLEFGQVDQPSPGAYITRYEGDQAFHVHTFWSL